MKRRHGLCEQRGCTELWDVSVIVGWRARFLCMLHAEEWRRRG